MRVPANGVRVRCPRCAHVFRLQAETVPVAPPSGEELTGIERDHREPPRLRPPQAQRRANDPPPASGSTRAPLPAMPAWQPDQERTLALDNPAAKGPAPRLETAPFRPGEAVAPPPPARPSPPPPSTPFVAPASAAPAPFVAPASSASAPGPSLPPFVATPPGSTAVAPPVVAAPPTAAPGTAPAHDRARRLARVLVSDILVYNQALRDQAHSEGRLASALGPEIGKAWELYKSKVSPEVVANTTYFKDALNEILAGGEKIF
jgi:hypothetical protein